MTDVKQAASDEGASPQKIDTGLEGAEIKPIEINNNLTYQGFDQEAAIEERIKEDMKMAFPGKGFLEVTYNGFGFLRPKFVPSSDDIYVSQSQIRKFWLRPGDDVEGLVRPPKMNEKFHGLLKIEKVNGAVMTDIESYQRKKFDNLTSLHPNRQIVLETDQDVLSTRIIDLVAPVGFGQRGLIVSQPKAGKTTLLKQIAAGIGQNFPKVHLMAIFIKQKPAYDIVM